MKIAGTISRSLAVDEARDEARAIAHSTLQELCAREPTAKQAVDRAAGYAVFSNFGMKMLVAGGGTGSAAAVSNETGREVFVRMAEVQAELGSASRSPAWSGFPKPGTALMISPTRVNRPPPERTPRWLRKPPASAPDRGCGSAGADLLINFDAELARETRVTQTASAPMYYGYRRGFYSGWGGYETRVDRYAADTLNIDLVDAKRKRLVWEGVAVGRVTDKQRHDREAMINAAVTEIFAKYPIRAGG